MSVDNWTPDQITEAISNAIRARDFESVKGLLLLLTTKDASLAADIYELLKAVTSS